MAAKGGTAHVSLPSRSSISVCSWQEQRERQQQAAWPKHTPCVSSFVEGRRWMSRAQVCESCQTGTSSSLYYNKTQSKWNRGAAPGTRYGCSRVADGNPKAIHPSIALLQLLAALFAWNQGTAPIPRVLATVSRRLNDGCPSPIHRIHLFRFFIPQSCRAGPPAHCKVNCRLAGGETNSLRTLLQVSPLKV